MAYSTFLKIKEHQLLRGQDMVAYQVFVLLYVPGIAGIRCWLWLLSQGVGCLGL